MYLRQKFAAIWRAKLAQAENIAPDLTTKFKRNTYDKAAVTPKKKEQVSVDPNAGPTAKPSASVPIPLVPYKPSQPPPVNAFMQQPGAFQ